MSFEIPFPQENNSPESDAEKEPNEAPPTSELQIEVIDYIQHVKDELGLSLTRRENAELIAREVNREFAKRYGRDAVVSVAQSGTDSVGRMRYRLITTIEEDTNEKTSIKEALRQLKEQSE